MTSVTSKDLAYVVPGKDEDAIHGLIEGKSSTQTAQAFGHNVNTLQFHRQRTKKELA